MSLGWKSGSNKYDTWAVCIFETQGLITGRKACYCILNLSQILKTYRSRHIRLKNLAVSGSAWNEHM